MGEIMQVTINGGCMDIRANPRVSDRKKVVAVVDQIVRESDGRIVIAGGTNDDSECWFTLSWRKGHYTVKEAREIYTDAKESILNQ